MASISRIANGHWRAQIFKQGVRDSKVFITKREAESWAARRESDILEEVATSPGIRKTLAQALQRYVEEVSPAKRGHRWEALRINAWIASGHPLFSLRVGDVRPEHVAAWRDARLAAVTSGTVLREFSLLSGVFEHARREWQWIKVNPVRDVRKPREPDHREVVISWSQIRGQLRALGYAPLSPVRTVNQACAVTFLVALRTGARAGELTGLTWENVSQRQMRVSGKTGARDIPVTSRTSRLLAKMRSFDPVSVFGVKAQTLDAMFRKARDRAGQSGYTFHDARHTAATWLAPRLDVLTLCKIFGWKNPKQAMTYYNPSAARIADRLE